MNSVRLLPFPLTDGSQLFDVDNFLADLERCAAQPIAPADFYEQLLSASSLAIGAKSAAYWSCSAGRLRVAFHYRSDRFCDGSDSPVRQRLEEVVRTQVARSISDRETGQVLLACPVRGAASTAGVLTHELSLEVDADSAGHLLELASAVAEIAGDFELRRDVATSGEAIRRWADLDLFLQRIYRAESVSAVSRELAEEGRRLVGCDRLCVLIRSGKSWQVTAVSGVDRPSRRAVAMQNMERLVRVVAAQGEPLIINGEPEELPPQVQCAVDEYFAGAAPRGLIVAPCALPVGEGEIAPRPDVALVLEQFQGVLPEDCLSPLRTISGHAAIAVTRALQQSSWPIVRWLHSSKRKSASRRLVLVTAVILALCGAVAALTLIPADLQISAEGRFVAADRMRVFAPMDAIVTRVLVKHGEKVAAGQKLLELGSPELELEMEQAEGLLATTRKEISALETARLRATLPSEKEKGDTNALAAKLAALRELAGSHQRRLDLLRAEAQRLHVVSPIEGEVISWKPEDYLQERPVERGQRLLEIANPAGGWEIELDVPDRRAGHILAARGAEPLRVSYVVKSDSASNHAGRVTSVSAATQPDDSGNPVVRVTVEPLNSSPAAPRSGMVVVAKIDCGQHALGYVWFHEAWEAFQRYWF